MDNSWANVITDASAVIIMDRGIMMLNNYLKRKARCRASPLPERLGPWSYTSHGETHAKAYVIDRIYVLHNYVLLTTTYSSYTIVLLTFKNW